MNPAPVEPLDRAILHLLDTLPLHWQPVDKDALTATEEEALHLLTKAGLIEERIRIRASMSGFPKAVNMQLRVTGDYQPADILSILFQPVPEWLDTNGRTRGQFYFQSEGVHEVRLTHEGELGKNDYNHNTTNHPSSVLAFVRGIGPLGLPRSSVAGTVRVESCQLEPVRKGDTPSRAGVGGHDPTTVRPNGISAHNQINSSAREIADLVCKKLSDQQPAAAVINIGSINARQSIVAGGSITAAGNIETGGKVHAGPQSSSKAEADRTLIRSTKWRLALWLVLLAGAECVVGLCAWGWAAGDNLWQRTINSWPWHVAALTGCVAVLPFLLGRKRLRLLKLWKGEDK